MKLKAMGIMVGGLLALLMPTSSALSQQLELQLKKIARRPAAVEPAPNQKLAEQEARRAARQILLEEERASLVEAARGMEQRAERESILRDVRQYQTIQRALSGLRR